jgi:hypothetical protein
MRWFIVAVLLTLAMVGVATAAHPYFAAISAVDAEKGTVTYTITTGKDRGMEIKAPVIKDCPIKEGYYRLGKPATTEEGDEVPDGLKNAVFQKATAEKPLSVNVYVATEDDADKGIKKGYVVKILVNPKPKDK